LADEELVAKATSTVWAPGASPALIHEKVLTLDVTELGMDSTVTNELGNTPVTTPSTNIRIWTATPDGTSLIWEPTSIRSVQLTSVVGQPIVIWGNALTKVVDSGRESSPVASLVFSSTNLGVVTGAAGAETPVSAGSPS
jgi:hypothetical protein